MFLRIVNTIMSSLSYSMYSCMTHNYYVIYINLHYMCMVYLYIVSQEREIHLILNILNTYCEWWNVISVPLIPSQTNYKMHGQRFVGVRTLLNQQYYIVYWMYWIKCIFDLIEYIYN